MERKDPLDADAAGNPSDGEVGRGALPVVKANDDALKNLDPFPFSLAVTEVYLYRIAGAKLRDVRIGFGLKQLSGVHELLPA